MLKKTTIIAFVVVVIVSCCCVPVSAATIKGDVYDVVLDYPSYGEVGISDADGANYVAVKDIDYSIYTNNGIRMVQLPAYTNDTGVYRSAVFWFEMPLKNTFKVESGDIVKLKTDFKLSFGSGPAFSYVRFFQLGFMYTYEDTDGVDFMMPMHTSGVINSYGGVFPVDITRQQNHKPEDGARIVDRMYLRMQVVYAYNDSTREKGYSFGFLDNNITIRYGDEDSVSLEIQNDKTNETLGEILEAEEVTQDKLDDLGDKQDLTNEKLDAVLQQPEQEKQEADGSGNEAVDGLTSVIPADNDGVIAALRNLSAAMSYTGTECKWKFPALYIPAIDGVTPRIDLTSEKDINFTEWIDAMPTDAIEVVRIIATIALILYCFKELYSLIKYILTMKGGGGGNE